MAETVLGGEGARIINPQSRRESAKGNDDDYTVRIFPIKRKRQTSESLTPRRGLACVASSSIFSSIE